MYRMRNTPQQRRAILCFQGAIATSAGDCIAVHNTRLQKQYTFHKTYQQLLKRRPLGVSICSSRRSTSTSTSSTQSHTTVEAHCYLHAMARPGRE